MSERWYKEAVIYCIEVDTYQDSDGDGCGDLSGVDTGDRPHQVLADGQYDPPPKNLARLELNGWGYRWIRLRRSAKA